MPTRKLRYLSAAITASTVIAAWFFLAPTSVGGRVSYLIATGSSMELGIHQGDLILARAPDDYRIGDIAAYQNKSVGKVVLHHIISRDADLFTLKGDNNSFIDEYRPTRLDLIGVPWVLIPGAGNILLWLATPLHAALVVGAFFFVMLGGLAFFVKKRRRLGRKSLPAKKQLRFPVPSPSRTVHSELPWGPWPCLLLPLALPGLLAHGRP